MENNFLKQLGLGQLAALRESLASFGGEMLHMIAPDNFEYYSCAFELLDENNNSVAYLSFDILPNNIAMQKQPIVSVVKTISRIYTVSNTSFNPFNISIQGTFGRKLRVLTSSKEVSEGNGFQRFLTGNIGAFFDSDFLVKTGYGAVKMLQKIIEKSHYSEYTLVFHNYAFNSHHKVKIVSFDFNISTENNFMWFYNVTMTAIGEWDMSKTIKEKAMQAAVNLLKNLTNSSIKHLLANVDSHISQYGMVAGEKYTDYENSVVEKKTFRGEINPWLKK